MLLRSGPQGTDHADASGFLQPAGSSWWLGAQLAASAARASGRPARGTGELQVLASTQEPQSGGSGRQHSNARASSSSRSEVPRIRLPKPSARAGWVGIGGGGIIYGGHAGRAQALWPFSRKPPAKPDAGKQHNVLIMMSNTGGGHRASAEAIRDAFTETFGDQYKVSIVDMWKEHTPAPFRAMPDSYAFLVRHSILWRLSYEITQPKAFHVPYLAFCGVFMRAGISAAFDKYQPNLVVSVHPLMQHVPLGVLRQRIQSGSMPPVNFATVVTDFTTCHNTWFHTSVTRCFVPTAYCASLARKNGLDDAQIIQHGLPIRPVFSKPLPKRDALRKRLGVLPHLPTVLLVGGGEGMGALEATVSELDAALGGSAQVVVVCGRNARLLARLQAAAPPNGLHVVAQGFVDNMHEWMAACDAIITKAGPGTIAEALIAGLPILLNGNIPCQEEGNIPYVIDNGVGDFETDPARIGHIMARWLQGSKEDHAQFAAMRAKSKSLGRPGAVYGIVRDLAKLADAPDFTHGPSTVLVQQRTAQRPATVAA